VPKKSIKAVNSTDKPVQNQPRREKEGENGEGAERRRETEGEEATSFNLTSVSLPAAGGRREEKEGSNVHQFKVRLHSHVKEEGGEGGGRRGGRSRREATYINLKSVCAPSCAEKCTKAVKPSDEPVQNQSNSLSYP
jgi:hypothetical protein